MDGTKTQAPGAGLTRAQALELVQKLTPDEAERESTPAGRAQA